MAVGSEKGLSDLSVELKTALAQTGARGLLIISAGRFNFEVRGYGHPGLKFSHTAEIVVRKTGFISDRTLMVNADRSASDVPREMVRLLQDPGCRVTVEISAKMP